MLKISSVFFALVFFFLYSVPTFSSNSISSNSPTEPPGRQEMGRQQENRNTNRGPHGEVVESRTMRGSIESHSVEVPFDFDSILDLEEVCRMVKGKWRVEMSEELRQRLMQKLEEMGNSSPDNPGDEENLKARKKALLELYREGLDLCSRKCNFEDNSECEDFDINLVWNEACSLAGGTFRDGKCVFKSRVSVPAPGELCSKLGGMPNTEDGNFKCEICN